MSVKRFRAASSANRGIKAEFEVEWEDDITHEPHVDTFYCYPARSTGVTFFELNTLGSGSLPMWQLFREVMGEEFDRFEAFLRDDRHNIKADTIRDIVAWLQEEQTGVPTPPSDS